MSRDQNRFEEHQYLMSEYANLVFLGEIEIYLLLNFAGCHGIARTPSRPHSSSWTKVQALWSTMPCETVIRKFKIYNTLRHLTQIKKTPIEHPFQEIGSLQSWMTTHSNTTSTYTLLYWLITATREKWKMHAYLCSVLD